MLSNSTPHRERAQASRISIINVARRARVSVDVTQIERLDVYTS